MRRRVIFAILTVLLAACGAVAWRFMGEHEEAHSAPAAASLFRSPPEWPNAGRPRISHRTRHRAGLQHGDRESPGRRAARQVVFTEGQDVKAGDVLAQIDPVRSRRSSIRPSPRSNWTKRSLANAKLNSIETWCWSSPARCRSGRARYPDAPWWLRLEAQVKLDQAAIDNAKVCLDYCTMFPRSAAAPAFGS